MSGDVKIAGYTILKELATGSFGKTYLAKSPDGKKVILKIMHPHLATEPEARMRFHREMEILKQLNHPQIVRLIEAGEHEGVPFLVLEYVDGPTLKEYLSENAPLPEKEALRILKQLAIAVSYLHQQGIIHRDLKPENIVMHKGKPVIIDFGLARKLELPSVTVDGAVLGTVYYIPPEVLNGGRYTEASDVYSLGVILYEMLTGNRPFSGNSFGELVEEILELEPECPPNASPDTCELIKKLLHKDPENRPSLDELITDWGYIRHGERFNLWKALAIGIFLIFVFWSAKHVGSFFSRGNKVRQETPSISDTLSGSGPIQLPESTESASGRGVVRFRFSSPSDIVFAGKRMRGVRDTVIESDTGEVEALVSSPFYGRLRKKFHVGSGTTDVRVDWDREVGMVYIKVRPWGEVYVDGRDIGSAPIDTPLKMVGTHVITIKHPVLGEINDTLRVHGGDTLRRQYVYQRQGGTKIAN